MLRTRLLSTSTFRLTLLYLGVFSLSAVALLVGVYWMSVRFMERQTEETLEVERQGLLEHYSLGQIDQLVAAIEQRAQDDRASIYVLTTIGTNEKIAGNYNPVPLDQIQGEDDIWRFSISVLPHARRGPEIHAAMGLVTNLDNQYILVVGRDIEDKLHVQQMLRLAILTGGGIMIVLGLAGGFVMSRWMLHRLEIVNRTTAQIMAGDLGRRIAVRGSADEFDELGRNLNAMLERIERLLTGMRQVTDDIAHDLRTPLNRLRSRIEVALMGEPTAAETHDLLEATLRDADGLIDTFNALLAIARAETGALRSEYERFDLGEVARDVYELYEPLAEEKGIALRLDIDDGVAVDGHRQLVAQAVANITDNAVKYTPAGGEVVVRIRGGAQPELAVVDNGPGIPADQRDRAKQRFVRLDATRTSPGSGLGLSLVDAVAKLHEARFELEDNAPGLAVRLLFRPPLRPTPDLSVRRAPAPVPA